MNNTQLKHLSKELKDIRRTILELKKNLKDIEKDLTNNGKKFYKLPHIRVKSILITSFKIEQRRKTYLEELLTRLIC